ncbi:MAG: TfoX/Sxy family protein [Candidatus Omnitrophica bacterium]|nr:TfoX/Sxy family protein [Candidatus Omnitrophota bacterium]
MAYDVLLEKRLDELIADRSDFHKQKMFGGLGYLLRGNMCFAIWKDSLILRLGQEQANKSLTSKNAQPFDITGRAMKGWVMVLPAGIKTGNILKEQIRLAIQYVSTLPRK